MENHIFYLYIHLFILKNRSSEAFSRIIFISYDTGTGWNLREGARARIPDRPGVTAVRCVCVSVSVCECVCVCLCVCVCV